MNTMTRTRKSSNFGRTVRILMAHLIRILLITVPIFAILIVNDATSHYITTSLDKEPLLKLMLLISDAMVTIILIVLCGAAGSLKVNKR